MFPPLLLITLASPLQTMTPEQQLCALRPVAAEHAGEVFKFRGQYGSDGRERARLDIEDCDYRYGVGGFAEGVAEQMDPENPMAIYLLPSRDVRALFTVKIVRVAPNTLQFQEDDGVRLMILAVSDVEPLE